MSSDSNLFHAGEELEKEVFKLQGNRFVHKEETYLPLYEGRMITHFDHRASSVGVQTETTFRSGVTEETSSEEHRSATYPAMPRYWVAKDEVEDSKPDFHEYKWFTGFRDVTSTTNERTFVNSFLPYSGVGHKVPMMFTQENAPYWGCLHANISSFVLDYSTRQKLGGVSLTYYVIKQLPLHPPERYTPELLEYIVPRVLELAYTAWDLTAYADDVWSEASVDLQSAIESQWQANVEATGGGHRGKTPPEWVEHSDQADEHFPHSPFMWDEERRRYLRADLDGLYGHLYGLEREELAYILDTFPIVKEQNEKECGEYRTKRLVLQAYDELEGTDMLHSSDREKKEAP